MRLFGKKSELTEEQKKWNKMWDLWANGLTDSPYAELMTYQSEVYNGGHGQYFDNVGNTGNLQKEIAALGTILPAKVKRMLQWAYGVFMELGEKESEIAGMDLDAIIEKCDDVFYEHEEEIDCILKKYASTMKL